MEFAAVTAMRNANTGNLSQSWLPPALNETQFRMGAATSSEVVSFMKRDVQELA
jgi:hypothetical protein